MGPLLDTVNVMKPIANPSETDGNPTSNPGIHEDLKHRLAERKRLQPDSSSSVALTAAVENKSLAPASNEDEGEHHGHSNGA